MVLGAKRLGWKLEAKRLGGKRLGGKRLGGETSCDLYRSYLSGVNQIIGSVATYLFMIRSFAICLEIAYELLVPRDLGQLLHYASITFLPKA